MVRIAEKAGPSRNGIWRQPQVGNRAMGRLLSPSRIQPKLVVAPAGDRFEVEADRVADAVVREPGRVSRLGQSISRISSTPLQRSCSKCEEEKLQRKEAGDARYLQRKCSQCEEEDIQRKATVGGPGLSISPAVERGIETARHGGQSIPRSLRSSLEPRFGVDLGGVRLHTDTAAASLAAAVHAHAFTTGNDIFFAAGRYQPDTIEGRRLLAHEVTHTIQQGNGGVALQREEDTAPVVTEAQAMAEIDRDAAQDIIEQTPEEVEAGKGKEEPIDAGKVAQQAKAAQADDGNGEIEIPDFDVASGECPKLWDEGPETEEPEKEEAASGDEGMYKYLVALVPSGGLGLLGDVAGLAAAYVWKKLPLSVRAAAINTVIDSSSSVFGSVPTELLGSIGGLFQAGIIGFLKRLRKVDDKEKVSLFEKVGGIVLGLNVDAKIGFAFGVVKGFFIDGLLGVVQMILDLVCFVPRALKFIENFASFLKNLPDEMLVTWNALKDLAASITSAIGGAVGELKGILYNPRRAIELLDMVYQAAKSQAQQIGEMIAETLLGYAHLPARKLGHKAGRLVGQAVFEVVATYFTAGAEAEILALKTAARQAVRWLLELGRKFFELVRQILPLLEKVANVIIRAAKYLTRLFKTVCEKLDQAIQRIIDFFYSILGFCRKGSFKCKRHSKKPPSDLSKCKGRFVSRKGGYAPHDDYCSRVTGRQRDFNITLGPVRRCNFDAKMGPLLVECKTGYGWLSNPTVQAKPWFAFATAALRAQALRCMATAVSCGHGYVWYCQNKHAAAYLQTLFKGLPPVLYKP